MCSWVLPRAPLRSGFGVARAHRPPKLLRQVRGSSPPRSHAHRWARLSICPRFRVRDVRPGVGRRPTLRPGLCSASPKEAPRAPSSRRSAPTSARTSNPGRVDRPHLSPALLLCFPQGSTHAPTSPERPRLPRRKRRTQAEPMGLTSARPCSASPRKHLRTDQRRGAGRTNGAARKLLRQPPTPRRAHPRPPVPSGSVDPAVWQPAPVALRRAAATVRVSVRRRRGPWAPVYEG